MAESEYTQKGMKAFNKSANADQKEIASLRKDAVGLLTPDLLKDYTEGGKFYGQSLVLAYGRQGGAVTFSPEQLKAFADAQGRKTGKFNNDAQGVPLMLLERSSRPIDIARAKDVRNATLYEIKGNILSFRVSGKEQPHYRVQIRLEGWGTALTSTKPYILAAREAAVGRLSIECPCGRHQYWYRYLATIGNFAIAPQEHDFPKIRNPRLAGCCCKHVLRALSVLKTNTLHLTLAKELERQRGSRNGFASKATARTLTSADMRALDHAAKVRAPREARMALNRFQREAAAFIESTKGRKDVQEKKSTLTPRQASKTRPQKAKPATPRIDNSARTIIVSAARAALGAGRARNDVLKGIGDAFGLGREQLDAILKEENL